MAEPIHMPPVTSLGDLEARVASLKAVIGKSVYLLGEALAEIRDGNRFPEAGFPSFAAYVETVLDMSVGAAYRALAVFDNFSHQIAERYGDDKLMAGLAWTRTTPKIEKAGDVIAADVRYRATDGTFVSKPFHMASAANIRAATCLLTDTARQRRRPDKALQKRIDAVLAALPKVPAKLHRGGWLEVVASGERQYVTVRAMPLDQLEACLGPLYGLVPEGS